MSTVPDQNFIVSSVLARFRDLNPVSIFKVIGMLEGRVRGFPCCPRVLTIYFLQSHFICNKILFSYFGCKSLVRLFLLNLTISARKYNCMFLFCRTGILDYSTDTGRVCSFFFQLGKARCGVVMYTHVFVLCLPA